MLPNAEAARRARDQRVVTRGVSTATNAGAGLDCLVADGDFCSEAGD